MHPDFSSYSEEMEKMKQCANCSVLLNDGAK